MENKKRIIFFFIIFSLNSCVEETIVDKYYSNELNSFKIVLSLYESTNSTEMDHLVLEVYDKKKMLPSFDDIKIHLENDCCKIKRDITIKEDEFEYTINDIDILFQKNNWIKIDLLFESAVVKKIYLYRNKNFRIKKFIGH